MADTDFYNLNANRFYPLLVRDSGHTDMYIDSLAKSVQLPTGLILDCGFTFGPVTPFNLQTDTVELYSIERTGDDLILSFKASTGNVLLFELKATDEFGTVHFTTSGFSGVSFVVAGDIQSTYDLLEAEGAIALVTDITKPILIEPALVVSEYRHMSTTVRVGNLAKITADNCCDEITPVDNVTVTVAGDAYGDIVFEAGYNMSVAVSPVENTLTFSPSVGDGKGVYCDDEELPEPGPECKDLIRSINGILPASNGAFTISVSNGFTIDPQPDEHTIVILSRIDTDIICE